VTKAELLARLRDYPDDAVVAILADPFGEPVPVSHVTDLVQTRYRDPGSPVVRYSSKRPGEFGPSESAYPVPPTRCRVVVVS
jgi:hypothetical protein